MSKPSDFNDSELWVINNTLKERYGREIEIQLGDSDIRLRPEHRELTPCPVVVWQVNDVHFVVFKTQPERYRCQFFYRGFQQYGTGTYEYDNIAECVTRLLQTQADHVLKEPLQRLPNL